MLRLELAASLETLWVYLHAYSLLQDSLQVHVHAVVGSFFHIAVTCSDPAPAGMLTYAAMSLNSFLATAPAWPTRNLPPHSVL